MESNGHISQCVAIATMVLLCNGVTFSAIRRLACLGLSYCYQHCLCVCVCDPVIDDALREVNTAVLALCLVAESNGHCND